jgi:hypothetical protein
MTAISVATIALLVLATPALASADTRCSAAVRGYQAPAGMVGDQSTALEIARTYLSAIYGAEQIAGEMPLKASVRDGIWHIEGSLKPGFKGGVAEIEICKSTGRVLSVRHGK